MTSGSADAASKTAGPAAPGIIDLIKPGRDLCLFVVAGEHSGDALGGQLMQALNAARPGRIRFLGVGGPLMEAQGLSSQFPLTDVAVMGIGAILKRLPTLIRRVNQTAAAAVAAQPDAVVIIDSPELTHPIARRIRRRAPAIPIIDYVSPSVWAWRPGRARKMRRYVDHVLALLPFEPGAHVRLGGPACTYVGHPLIERLEWIAALDPSPLAARLGLRPADPVLVVLPGSRRSEAGRLMQSFGDAVRRVHAAGTVFSVLVPVVDHVRDIVEAGTADWPVQPHFVTGGEDKWRAFKLARVALAASGTVTLELALAGAPMVVGYKVEPVMAPFLRRMIKAPTIILPNLVLGDLVFKEYCQEACTGDRLGDALLALMKEGPERQRQLDALARVPEAMRLDSGTPSEVAARIVLRHAETWR